LLAFALQNLIDTITPEKITKILIKEDINEILKHEL